MSEKVRVHEIAKELGIVSKEVVEKAASMGISVKTASSSVSMEEAEKIMNFIMNGAPVEPKPKKIVVKKKAKVETTPETKEVTQEKKTTDDIKKVDTKKEDMVVSETTKEEKNEKKEEVTQVPSKTESQETKSETSSKIVAEEKAAKTEKAPVKKMTAGESKLKTVEPKKRSGLKIVKKKKPKPVENMAIQKDEIKKVSSYGKLSQDALAELAAKKSKKSSSAPVRKQESGNKIDIFGGSMADVSMDLGGGEEVVLLDLKTVDAKPVEEPKPFKRQPRPIGRNSNPGKNAGKRRSVSRDKRKKYIKDVIEEVVTHVEIPEDIRVYEFAEKLKRPIADVIKVLFNLGIMATKNDFLSKDEIEILSEEFEVEVSVVDPKDAFKVDEIKEVTLEDPDAVERPPVVTIMGHVDHGKTTLLDAIRDAKVTEGEAGGITQHIGAYSVVQNGKKITFIDTPGHAAFSGMRSRGADITDVLVIVVAADDGVKPQTKEVIKIAKNSGMPVIVALNKMDKEGANPDLVKGQMAELGITPVDWGGDVEFVPVSAKKGEGIDDLLENILLTADVMELRANPKAQGRAIVVESSVEKGRGPVATVIVQSGAIKVGDNVVCGSAHGRIKSLLDTHQKQLKEISLSDAAVVVGLNEVPSSGETMLVTANAKEARDLAQKRHEYDRHKELSKSTKTTLDELSGLIAEGKLKQLKVVLKTDVHGTLEAIRSSLEEMRNDEVKVEVISSGVGGITENDVELVNNSENCLLIGFNVRPTGAVKAAAKQKGVEIKTYSVIYQLIDDVTNMLTGMMESKYTEENTGQAEVREVFKVPKGLVAGCVVVDGKLIRGGLVRVIRDGVVLHVADITSLRRFKDDVSEVGNGYECGVGIAGYEDVRAGDVLETFKKVEQKVEL